MKTNTYKQPTSSCFTAGRTCSLILLLAAFCALANAQSTDPANPTLITSKKVEGKGSGAGATYYYRYPAKKGSVKISLAGQTDNYATQFEADLTNDYGVDLGKIYVSASDQQKHTLQVFNFAKDQPVNIVVKLSKDDTLKWQYFSLTFGGAGDAGVIATGSEPEPAQSAPDLVVSEIIFDQSPGQIRVRVMNVGNAASSACFLALISGAKDPSIVTKRRVWSINIPALDAGKGFSTVVDVWPLTQTNGPWKAIVDRSNSVEESNETNNSFTHPLQ
jgi:hypothetical protein